jgi:uncharacterized protein YjbJ (UPF0337 family)
MAQKGVVPKRARKMSDEHKGEEMKGRVKEAVDDVTGDEGLKREGKVIRQARRLSGKPGKPPTP